MRWRIVPDRDVVIAVNANGGRAVALIDDILTAVLGQVAEVDVPPRARPPAEPVPFDANGYVGSFAGPLTTYEGAHPVIVFVHNGRYLHDSRALPRVG